MGTSLLHQKKGGEANAIHENAQFLTCLSEDSDI